MLNPLSSLSDGLLAKGDRPALALAVAGLLFSEGTESIVVVQAEQLNHVSALEVLVEQELLVGVTQSLTEIARESVYVTQALIPFDVENRQETSPLAVSAFQEIVSPNVENLFEFQSIGLGQTLPVFPVSTEQAIDFETLTIERFTSFEIVTTETRNVVNSVSISGLLNLNYREVEQFNNVYVVNVSVNSTSIDPVEVLAFVEDDMFIVTEITQKYKLTMR